MKSVPVLFSYLTYAGSIPFIACAALIAGGDNTFDFFGRTLEAQQILGIYSIIIASFMAGAHWGQHLNKGDLWALVLPLSSNACALILLFAYILLQFSTFIILTAILFAYLLYVDVRLYRADHISQLYIKTRCIVTSMVVASLLIAWLAL